MQQVWPARLARGNILYCQHLPGIDSFHNAGPFHKVVRDFWADIMQLSVPYITLHDFW